jgi:hypothetical protein
VQEIESRLPAVAADYAASGRPDRRFSPPSPAKISSS